MADGPAQATTTYQRWRYAVKPASWPKLAVPATLGQALGIAHLGRIDMAPAAIGAVWTTTLLVAIVLLNDWMDRDVDALKRQMFPSAGSPKTIPDRILPAHQLLGVGVLAATASVAIAYWAEHFLNRAGLGLSGLACLLVFLAYSFPPVRLNYRGGGELLEMIGCGVALPWINAYMQGGLGKLDDQLWLPRAWPVLGGLMLLALASAIASGLSDEMSDRRGGKRTFTTTFGNVWSRRVAESLLVAAIVAWALAGLVAEHVPLLAVVPASVVVLYHHRRLLRLSTSAVTNAFEAQAHYKNELHLATWRGPRTLAFLLVVHRVFLS